MSKVYDDNNIAEEGYHFQIPREHILELPYRLNLPENWYTTPINKSSIPKERDESYWVNIYRVLLRTGLSSEWILSPYKVNNDFTITTFNESTLGGKETLKVFCDISNNGHEITNEYGPVF